MLSSGEVFRGPTQAPLIGEVELRWSNAFLKILEEGPAAFLWGLSRQLSASRPVGAFDSSPAELKFSVLQSDSARTEFRRPASVFLARTEEGFVWELPELGVFASGASDQAAMEGLQEQLALLRDTYAREDESNLTPSGLELKRRVIDLLGS
jgi:hypothetical protein